MVREKQSTVDSRQSTAKSRKTRAGGKIWRLLAFLLLTVNWQLSTAFPQSFNVASMNEVRYANAYAGANAGAKISACLAALPSTGGVCDARGLTGAQTLSSAITLGGDGKPATLILGQGVIITCNVAPCIIVDSNGHLDGAAISGLPAITSPPIYPANAANTVIRLGDGVNPGARGVIESANFAVLSGTNGTGGGIPSNFSLRNISVDGNRANNTSGMGIALYAFQDTLDNVEVHSAASHGIWHELGVAAPPQTSVLVRGAHIKAHNNGGDGIHDIGPTDQMWSEVETSTNNGHGIYAGKTATSTGSGTSFWYQVDSYSNGQGGTGDGFRDEASSIIDGAQLGAGNTGCGLKVNFASAGSYNLEAVHGNALGGICVGSGGVAPTTGTFRGTVYSNTAGELILTNSGGDNHFDLNLVDWNSPLKHVVGSFAPSDSYDLRESGGGGGHLVRLADGGRLGPLLFHSGSNVLDLGDGTAAQAFSVNSDTSGVPYFQLWRNTQGAWQWRMNDNLGSNSAEFASPALGLPLQMRSAATGSGEVRFNDPITARGVITSTVSPGAAPLVVASDTPVPLLVTQSHPRVQDCGTTTTCAGGYTSTAQIVYGTAPLSAGSATVTSLSPAFANTNFICVASDNTDATKPAHALAASANSITLAGNGNDTLAYQCMGISAGGSGGGASGGGGGAGGATYAGPQFPSTAVDASGVGTIAWSNASNATAEDGSLASATMTSANSTSHYLRAGTYGFSIPGGATVDGIIVQVKKKASTSNDVCKDYRVDLTKTGLEIGANKAQPGYWNDTLQWYTYGGPTDLWGSTWSAADINNTGFGASISVTDEGYSPPNTCNIDAVKITVYYH